MTGEYPFESQSCDLQELCSQILRGVSEASLLGGQKIKKNMLNYYLVSDV